MTLRKETEEALFARMEKLGILEKDLEERFILGSGRGGQKVNKTSSCVYLKHIPSSIEIKCQKERSRTLNRYYARKLLCEKLEESIFKEKSTKQRAIEKIRRQKRKRTKRGQQKVLRDKKLRGDVKGLRGRAEGE